MALFGKPDQRHELGKIPEDVVGLLEPGVELEGRLKVSGGLIRLNCHIKGEIHSEGTVVIHDQGEVEGTIQAKLVSVTGKVKGSIHASERLEIKEKSIVLGDIYTPSLLVDPGGYLEGQCHMPSPVPASAAGPRIDASQRPPKS